MSPNLEEFNQSIINQPLNGPVLYLTPIIDTILQSPESDPELDHRTEIQLLNDDATNRNHIINLEDNLRDLLVQVADTEDLIRVTQIKLRVIARDLTLQRLGIYMPALRELILDGSIVSSLRDLGCGLKNLKILRVNRCGLTCLDGMFGLESLEELYAADNSIENFIPCAFLPYIKVIDLSRNCLKNIQNLTFLSLCAQLEHLWVEGNEKISQFPTYRVQVKTLLPSLKTIDGIRLIDVLDEFPLENNSEIEPSTSNNALNTSKTRPSSKDKPSSFLIRFPPKIFLDRPSSRNSNSSRDDKCTKCDELQDAEAFPLIFRETKTNEDETD